MMFNAAPIAATVAIIALAGSLVFITIPTEERPASVPAAPMDDIDPADFAGFAGEMRCGSGRDGKRVETDFGNKVEGETYPRCTVDVGDPRFDGKMFSVHDYFRYDGKPTWGVRNVSAVITNDDGHWISTSNWGYQQPLDGTMNYAMQWRGEGAYEGLSALSMLTQDGFGLTLDMEGVIFPGDLPTAPVLPLEDVLGVD